MSITPGTQLGPYEIRSHLGTGGMGEVYYAIDTRLGRPVAIKLLRREITKYSLRRFKQEAQAASSLNHPNILTIYDVGQAEAAHYIVSEFVDGITLRQHMRRRRMSLTEILDVVIQVATGLEAAHAKGIVHRDMKPENVMLRADGHVKILDFGLAKLLEKVERLPDDSEISTATEISTDSGVIVGTVAYMSPEQLRGQNVDGRSDIWSLGVMFYEILAGNPPFDLTTKSNLIVSILEREPSSLPRQVLEDAPDIRRIVMKTLHKDRGERYQTVKELLEELKSVKDYVDSEIKRGHKVSARQEVGSAERVDKTDPVGKAEGSWDTGYIKSEIKRYGRGAYVLLILSAALAGLFFAWRGYKGSQKAEEPLNKMAFTRLAMTRHVMDSVISPDGKYVAMIVADIGKQSILVKRISTATDIEILAPAEAQYSGLSFSPNGDYVYYLKLEESGSSLFRVSALGGTSRKLIDQVNTPVTFSPDGRQIAFVRKKSDAAVLMVANEDGSEEKELAVSQSPNMFSALADLRNTPAWSPDGEIIVCATINQGEHRRMGITEVRVRDGAMKEITTQPWYLIGQMSWLPKGNGLIINAEDQAPPTSTFQIWLLKYPTGEARRLTNDVNYYGRASLTANGEMLLTTQNKQASSIWIIYRGESTHAEQVKSSQGKGTGGITWTPDGKIVYASDESGNQAIWEMQMSGGDVKQLTFNESTEVEPVVSPDGRTIVFVSYRAGQPHIWRMDADGTNQEQLTFGPYEEDWPQISPDGRWVVYHSENFLVDSIWKIPMEGGRPVKLTERVAKHPTISPDGKLIACYSKEGAHNSPWELTILPFTGDKIVKSFPIPTSVSQQWHGLRWTPDGSALTYVVNSGTRSDLWSQAIRGGTPQKITDFKDGQIDAFAWSSDGKYMACVRTTTITEVVLVENSNKWQ